MKILFITNIPSPYRVDFFNEWGKTVELTVIFEGRFEDFKLNWKKNEKMSFESVYLTPGAVNRKKLSFKIIRYVQKNKFDGIVITNYSNLPELLTLLYLRIAKIKFFLEVDGGIIKQDNVLRKIFKSFLVSKASWYLSSSKETDDYLIHYGAKPEAIHRYPFSSQRNADVLEVPVNDETVKGIRKKLYITEEKVIVAVGQFIYRKGFDVLLEAAGSIDKNVGIYIVGGTPTEDYLRIKKELGLTNVHFVDFKTSEQLREYYKAANVFVLPTREDIWGLVVNEAMACGLPVITTDKCVAGLALVRDDENGYIVRVDDKDQLAEKINKILRDDDLRQQMSANSLKKIREYTIEEMAIRHNEIFDEILGLKGKTNEAKD